MCDFRGKTFFLHPPTNQRENDGSDWNCLRQKMLNYGLHITPVKKFDAIVVKYAKNCGRAPWAPWPHKWFIKDRI